MNIGIVICVVSAAVVALDEQAYCTLRYRRLCQGKGQHVACEYPQPGPAPLCQNYSQIEFNRELTDFIIHDVNRRRQRAAAGHERVRGGVPLPRSEVMMLVSWDRELAFLAQRLADQCQFIHDDCRATVRYPYAGQSVGEVRFRQSRTRETQSIQRAMRRVLDAWWGERRRVRPSQLTAPLKLSAKGLIWGHFGQLVVWSLRAVGCGAVTHGTTFLRLLLVCDFSHTNMLGQRTIKPGPLSPCPVHTGRRPRARYPLLCAPLRRVIVESNVEDGHDDDGEDVTYNDEYDGSADTPTTQEDRIDNDDRSRAEIHKERPAEDTVKPATLYWNKYKINYKTGKGFLQQTIARKTLYETTYTEESGDDEETSSGGRSTGGRQDAGRSRNTESTLRTRWKQTRVRLNRPGAHALRTPRPNVTRRPAPSVSFTLDKEDLDQVFQDTGFNVSWQKQKKRV